MWREKKLVFLLSVALLFPAVAYGQASISGVVKDTSGAVLPGVTIEAASPVLIEKSRSAVTDGGRVVPARRFETGRLCRHIHVDRVLDGQTRERRALRIVHRDGER